MVKHNHTQTTGNLHSLSYILALEHEGLYRLAAVKSHILAVKALYNKGTERDAFVVVNCIVFCLKGILSTCRSTILTQWLVCSNCFSESSRNLSFHRNCFLDSRQLFVSLNVASLSDHDLFSIFTIVPSSVLSLRYGLQGDAASYSKTPVGRAACLQLSPPGMAANPYGTCSSKCK